MLILMKYIPITCSPTHTCTCMYFRKIRDSTTGARFSDSEFPKTKVIKISNLKLTNLKIIFCKYFHTIYSWDILLFVRNKFTVELQFSSYEDNEWYCEFFKMDKNKALSSMLFVIEHANKFVISVINCWLN